MDAVTLFNSYSIVINGRLSDGKGKLLGQQRFTRRFDPWFYLHTRDIKPNTKELARVFDYLFRYDRGAFRVTSAFDRVVWNEFLHTRALYAFLHAKGTQNDLIAQDIAFPKTTGASFVSWNATDPNVWPIWLCPLRGDYLPGNAKMELGGTADELAINVGIWGQDCKMIANYKASVKHNRQIEEETR